MRGTIHLAKLALSRALRLRRAYGIAVTSPVCPVDLAEWRGVEVRFVNVPSMEAMYRGDKSPLILINSDRPMGRRMFSCAHELGHHEFVHGSRIDDVPLQTVRSSRNGDEERLADLFAAFLLMPKSVVDHAFAVRNLQASTATAEQAYLVAGALGVSYDALVTQLQVTLKLISAAQAKVLRVVSLQSIRESILGRRCDRPLTVVDRHWSGRAIDVEVGDTLLAPSEVVALDGRLAVQDRLPHGVLMTATAPGISQLMLPDGSWSSYVRVSRPGFVGRAVFRHLPEADDD